jgi:hypothetical protein
MLRSDAHDFEGKFDIRVFAARYFHKEKTSVRRKRFGFFDGYLSIKIQIHLATNENKYGLGRIMLAFTE